jgi:hypothetical protein
MPDDARSLTAYEIYDHAGMTIVPHWPLRGLWRGWWGEGALKTLN